MKPTNISDTEIERAIGPYVRGYFAADSDEWSSLMARAELQAQKRERTRDADPSTRSAAVKEVYEKLWADVGDSGIAKTDKTVTCLWGERRLTMSPTGIKRVYLLYLYRLLAQLNARSVLEVGCGAGTNLVLLANRFPAIRFSGVELTRAGVEQCERLRTSPLVPELAAIAPEPLESRDAHRQIEFRQGDAAELPYPDDSFDVVLTVLALEQMEPIREQALSETSRVCSGHVIMIEPFRDWNGEGVRRRYIDSAGYFAASVAELPRYGLTHVFATDNFPAKINLGVGIVVAAKTQAPR